MNKMPRDIKEVICDITDTETLTAKCFSHLSVLTKNSKIREAFKFGIGVAQKNKTTMLTKLDEIGVKDFCSVDKCKLCKLNPDSFSLSGSVNLAIEVINVAVKNYKELLDYNLGSDDHQLFKTMLSEKLKQKKFLVHENSVLEQRDYQSYKKSLMGVIGEYCMKQVVS